MSLALPCLAAALREWAGEDCLLVEGQVGLGQDLVEEIGREGFPRWLGMSCYPWNVDELAGMGLELRRRGFGGTLVFGGPEALRVEERFLEELGEGSWVVHGEGELALPALLEAVDEGGRLLGELPPGGCVGVSGGRVLRGGKAELPDLGILPSPFAMGLVDLGRPFVYYEASRGCPFHCEYCSYSLTEGIRSFSRERIFEDLRLLTESAVQNVIFVDRSFNLQPKLGEEILAYLLEHGKHCRFQFEIYPERLTEGLVELLCQGPADMFQLEVGIQTTGGEALKALKRRGDFEGAVKKLEPFLRERRVRVHADMIVGLPGEGRKEALQTLGDILSAAPHSLQINTLKLLPETALRLRAPSIGLEFSPTPPYEIVGAPWLDPEALAELKTVRRLVYLYWNVEAFQGVISILARWVFEGAGELFDAMRKFWEERGYPLWGKPRAFWFQALGEWMEDLEGKVWGEGEEDGNEKERTGPVALSALTSARDLLRWNYLQGRPFERRLPGWLFPGGRGEDWSLAGPRRAGDGKVPRLRWGMRLERFRHALWERPLAGSRWDEGELPVGEELFRLCRFETDRSCPPSIEVLGDEGICLASLWKALRGEEGHGDVVEGARRLGWVIGSA